MKFPLALIGGSLLLAMPAANATYMLVNASGVIKSSTDTTNYLGYGFGPKGDGNQSVVGQSINLSFMLDLDLAGNDLLGGSQSGRASYAGSTCPGAGHSWITTLGVSIGGAAVSSLFNAPANFQECDQASMWDKELNGRGIEEFSAQDLQVNHDAATFADGSSLSRDYSQQTAINAHSDLLNLFNGVSLDQSFSLVDDGTNSIGGGDFFQQMMLSSCTAAGICASANAINVQFAWSTSSITGQIIRNVPEPGTLALLGIGLLGIAVARRPRQPLTPAQR